MTEPIKYLLIGSVSTNKIIYKYKGKDINDNIKETSNKIFEKICKANNNNYEKRNKINDGDFCYYFIVYENGDFYLTFVEKSYSQSDIFELISELENDEKINVSSYKENDIGSDIKQYIKGKINKYQNVSSTIKEIKKDVKEIKDNLKKDIDNIVKNEENITILEEKTEQLLENSKEYKKNTDEVRRATCCMNCRIFFILILVIILLIAVVVGVLYIFKIISI